MRGHARPLEVGGEPPGGLPGADERHAHRAWTRAPAVGSPHQLRDAPATIDDEQPIRPLEPVERSMSQTTAAVAVAPATVSSGMDDPHDG